MAFKGVTGGSDGKMFAMRMVQQQSMATASASLPAGTMFAPCAGAPAMGGMHAGMAGMGVLQPQAPLPAPAHSTLAPVTGISAKDVSGMDEETKKKLNLVDAILNTEAAKKKKKADEKKQQKSETKQIALEEHRRNSKTPEFRERKSYTDTVPLLITHQLEFVNNIKARLSTDALRDDPLQRAWRDSWINMGGQRAQHHEDEIGGVAEVSV